MWHLKDLNFLMQNYSLLIFCILKYFSRTNKIHSNLICEHSNHKNYLLSLSFVLKLELGNKELFDSQILLLLKTQNIPVLVIQIHLTMYDQYYNTKICIRVLFVVTGVMLLTGKMHLYWWYFATVYMMCR